MTTATKQAQTEYQRTGVVTREMYLATAKAHLRIAEAYRSVGKTADMNAAYRAADKCALHAEKMLPKSQRVIG